MNIVTRPLFYQDVADEIAELAHRANPEIALRWHSALESTIEQLARHPHLGRLRHDLFPEGVRTWRLNDFSRWLIFYLTRDDNLVLLRVRHGMMDLGRLEM